MTLTEPQLPAPTVSVARRPATRADIPFLAEVTERASTPPFQRPLWAELVEGFGIGVRPFLVAMYEADASNWGNAPDFLVLTVDRAPAAACAVFAPDPSPGADHRYLRLDRLPALAVRLGWDDRTVRDFRATYDAYWGTGGAEALAPQAPAIIENVAVLPPYAGLGLGDRLMAEAKAAARRAGHARLGVAVIHGNDRAERLYRRHFRPYASFHPAYFDDAFPGLTKFVADV